MACLSLIPCGALHFILHVLTAVILLFFLFTAEVIWTALISCNFDLLLLCFLHFFGQRNSTREIWCDIFLHGTLKVLVYCLVESLVCYTSVTNCGIVQARELCYVLLLRMSSLVPWCVAPFFSMNSKFYECWIVICYYFTIIDWRLIWSLHVKPFSTLGEHPKKIEKL